MPNRTNLEKCFKPIRSLIVKRIIAFFSKPQVANFLLIAAVLVTMDILFLGIHKYLYSGRFITNPSHTPSLWEILTMDAVFGLFELIFWALIFFIPPKILVRYVASGKTLFSADGVSLFQPQIRSENPRFRWDQVWKNLVILANPGTSCHFSMGVTPITPNPKARNIVTNLHIKLKDGLENLQLLRAKLGDDWYHWHTTVQSLLYDFHENHSIQLGALFNPLRPEQQATFRQLVDDFFGHRLAEMGLEVDEASFQLKS